MIDTAILTEFAMKFGLPSALFVTCVLFLLREYKEEKRISREREQQIHEDAKQREERLMAHVDKMQETQEKIASTLEKMEFRIERLENNFGTK
ncbi:hypothetical protein ABE237_00910 [Brevibacillus formosus]|uniref:hypothetical protein n=1 Tax=Brevibacillus formosus TaxID=54913 RepID=UPI0018CD177B|nr:hypothetical protein [Brevibacillus formosus]MBG9944705.1 hypothetical protein [Brevibacillus formosus]